MNVLVKNLGNGIKNVKINDPKTYNSLSFGTLRSLLNTFKKLNKDSVNNWIDVQKKLLKLDPIVRWLALAWVFGSAVFTHTRFIILMEGVIDFR